MPTPLISICLPNLNTRPFLEARMESLLQQTVTDWELIVCDSYSTDGSWEFFQKFSGDRRVQLHQVPKTGVYAGWNECLKRVKGQFVYIATSDDTAEPSLLESLLGNFDNHPQTSISACNHYEIDESGARIDSKTLISRQPLALYSERNCYIPQETLFMLLSNVGIPWTSVTAALIRTSLFERVGHFPLGFGTYGDYAWALRASFHTGFAHCPKELATWRRHVSQLTTQKMQPKDYHILLTAINNVLELNHQEIPESWLAVPAWRKEIKLIKQMELRESLQLYRWNLLKQPLQFLGRLAETARLDSGWILHQFKNLFAGGEELQVNYNERLQNLSTMLRIPWPPK